jgi:hypothetical protein
MPERNHFISGGMMGFAPGTTSLRAAVPSLNPSYEYAATRSEATRLDDGGLPTWAYNQGQPEQPTMAAIP